jgi:TNF receptor-associated protein 1
MTEVGETVGLTDYVKRMKERPEGHLLSGRHRPAAPSKAARIVEAFKAKGIEVLFMFEHIDEYVVSSLNKFEDKDLKAVNADDIDLGDATPREKPSPKPKRPPCVTG